jgi:hypothetical protein
MKLIATVYSFLAMTVLFISKPAFAQTPSGVVIEAEGLAEIKNSNGVVIASTATGSDRRIIKDAPFYEGETIVTGTNGKLKLQFAEGQNEVLMGPNTTLVIQKAPFDLRMKRGTRLFLDSGSIDSNIKQKYSGSDGDEFSVETRTLVAGVRGTVFHVKHHKAQNSSEVSVSSGKVEVRSISDQKVRGVLTAGQSMNSKEWETTVQQSPKPDQNNKPTKLLK